MTGRGRTTPRVLAYLTMVSPLAVKASEVTALKWLWSTQRHRLERRSHSRMPQSAEEENSCRRLMSGWK